MQRREFIKNSAILVAGAATVSNLNAASETTALKTPRITLNNGVQIPQIGYGVFKIAPEQCQKCVENAIEVGYEMIDTAQSYFNEEGVGAAVRASGVKRENIFITTKLASDYIAEEGALREFDASMKRLGLDYLDLFLLHQPYNDVYGAWRALVRLMREGRVRAIGVSNFYADRIMDFCLNNEVKPALNQIEIHPFHQRVEELAVMKEWGVAAQAWSPLAAANKEVFANPVLAKIAANHGKSVAQVMLRWNIQRGVIVIPKTTKIERMRENLDIFDFALSEDEMAQIAALDRKTSVFFDHRDPSAVKRIYELMRSRRANGGKA